jgi:hypothetical protein
MRIRSLKPDFWRDEVTGLMEPGLALFYLGLACHADDDGRFEWVPALIRADLDPFDAKWGGVQGVSEQLERLVSAGRVVRYVAEGRTYGFIPTQKRHQKPNRPTPSKLPPPPAPLTASAVSQQGVLPAGEGEEREKEREKEPERARASREARVGVGHPAFEAIDHWTRTVWPSLSSAECPAVTTAQAQSLAVLCAKHTPAVLVDAMSAAAADDFWGPKLDLDTFIAKHARWLGRKPQAQHADPRVGVAAPAPASAFGEGGQRAIE